MNNIRYARMTATEKDVYEACRAAAVHDKIMSFPDGMRLIALVSTICSLTLVGYNSKVGDRGV